MDLDFDYIINTWVKDKSGIQGLLDNPINRRLVKAGGAGYQILNESTGKNNAMRGVNPALMECFWPQMSKKSKAFKRPSKKTKKPKPFSLKTRTGQEAARGHVRGTIIHRQVEDLVTLNPASFQLRHPQVRFIASVLQQLISPQGAHKWSTQLARAIVDNRKWRPIGSEVMVADEELGIATEIDMICVDREGVLHFIEMKTGYATLEEWRGCQGKMREPLHTMFADPKTPTMGTNSAQNRAIVQIMFGAMLAFAGHKLQCRYQCWVVHVNDNGTEFLPVDVDLINNFGPLARAKLLKHQKLVKARRSEARKGKKKGDI